MILVFSRCRKLPKALKDWEAFNELKKKIDDFNECCPLLELMADKSMKDRHWQRIGSLTNHHFDVENENFVLRNIMEAPLLEFKEDIEVLFLTIEIQLSQRKLEAFIGPFINAKPNQYCCLHCCLPGLQKRSGVSVPINLGLLGTFKLKFLISRKT